MDLGTSPSSVVKLVLIGVGLTAAWELVLGGVECLGAVLRPGVLAYVALSLLSWPATTVRRESLIWKLWMVAALVAIAELPMMAVRPADVAVRAALLGLGLAVAAVLAIAIRIAMRWHHPLVPSNRRAIIIFAISLIVVVLNQAFNRVALSAGVPNDERSVLIAGFEVHHLNWGVILLVLTPTLSGPSVGHALAEKLIIFALGVGNGLVLDQWLYYMRVVVTDETYFAPSTLLSAIAGTGVALAAWLLHNRKHTSYFQMP